MASLPIDDTGADDTAVAAIDEPAQLSEVEQLAAEMGWKPEADFSGPVGKWKPAKDYILRGKEIQDGLRDTTKDLKRTMEQMAATGAKMTERALREQAKEIEDRFKEAQDRNDVAGAVKAARDMDELQAEVKTLKSDNPEKDFADRNPWYNNNRKARALAILTSQEGQRDGKSVSEQLEAAEKAVREEFPELFEDTKSAARKAPEVATPNARSTSITRARGSNDLPSDVKKAAENYADMFEKKFPGKQSRQSYIDDYAKDYFAEQA